MSAKAILTGMFKALAIAGLVAAIGCGREEREAKDLANEGNGKLAAANATIEEMNSKYQINLLPAYPSFVDESLKTFDWKRFTPEQRKTIRTKLTNHRSDIGRIKEIANHKNVSSGVNQQALAMSSTYAQKYLTSLETFEKKNGVSASRGSLHVEVASAAENDLRLVEARELEAKTTASAAILKVSYNLSVEEATGENANRDWEKVDKFTLMKIKARLQEYQVNIERLVQLSIEGVEVAELDKKKASRETAGSYLMSIQDFESKQTKQIPVNPWPNQKSETKQQSQGTVVTSTEQEAGL